MSSSIEPSVFAFERASNGPIVINWIGEEHVLYSGTSLISLVSLSDMIESSYRSWDLYMTGQLVDGLQQKKKTSFHLTEMESCRLSRATN